MLGLAAAALLLLAGRTLGISRTVVGALIPRDREFGWRAVIVFRSWTRVTDGLAEFGIFARVGCSGVEQLLRIVADPRDTRTSEVSRVCSGGGAQLRMLKAQILEFDHLINAWHRSSGCDWQHRGVPALPLRFEFGEQLRMAFHKICAFSGPLCAGARGQATLPCAPASCGRMH